MLSATASIKDSIVSEADPSFDVAAPDTVKEAVERARRQAGTIQVPEAFERDASPEQREARRLLSLAKEAKAEEQELEKDLDGVIKARWKIQVQFAFDKKFNRGRTIHGPNLVGIQVFESGKRLHGGGDELAYWCLDNREKESSGCGAIIPPEFVNKSGSALCPNCKRAVVSELLTSMKVYRNTTRELARVVTDLFHKLGGNADIYTKYDVGDPHYEAVRRAKGSAYASRLRGLHIYALKNIVKDQGRGSSLEDLFMAFLAS